MLWAVALVGPRAVRVHEVRRWELRGITYDINWQGAEHNLSATDDARLGVINCCNKAVDAAAGYSATLARDEDVAGDAYADSTQRPPMPDPYFFTRGGAAITGDPARSLRRAVTSVLPPGHPGVGLGRVGGWG